jgi:tripartite-type tricarboxylate transporter receptor subunit TctC
MIRIDHNIETNEVTEIEMTKEEIATHNAALEKAIQKENAKETAREAVLAKLGLTVEEIAALLS